MGGVQILPLQILPLNAVRTAGWTDAHLPLTAVDDYMLLSAWCSVMMIA